MSTLLTDDPPHPNATYSGLMLVEELLRLKRVAENKRLAREAVAKHRGRPDSVPHIETPVVSVCERPWATERDLLADVTMSDLTPRLLTDEQRGQSDSTNGKMHRLLTESL